MRKDWKTRRLSRRHIFALGVLLVLLPLVFATQAVANHITLANPPTFTFTADENGADDQPGQKDLTAHAVATPSIGDLWVAWKWDVTGLSGNNTGDACALFDTDTDSKVNSALCVTIGQNPAAQLSQSPRVYQCGDAKVDRCTSTVTQVSPIHSVCETNSASTGVTFPGGASSGTDTQATCHVFLGDLSVGGGAANLVNTCSYPSEQPNSDPSDCVLIPRDAFIRIAKDADPNAGSFPFSLDSTLVFTASGDATSQYFAIRSDVTHTVSEAAVSGWDVTGTPSCTGASGTGSSNGSYTAATRTIGNIDASPDNLITCTFNNRQRASIDISKTGNDSGAQTGAVFTLYTGYGTAQQATVGACTVDSGGHCDSNDASYDDPSFANLIPAVQYTIDETTVPSGYTKPASLPQNVTLTAGQAFTVSYIDAAQPGSAAITKLDDAGNAVAGAVFKVYQPTSGTTSPPTGTEVASCTTGANGTCTISNLAPGTYTIDESSVPSGYAKDSSFPKDITITRGTATPVSAADPRLFKVIVLVCKKTDNTLYGSKVAFDGGSLPASANSLVTPPGTLTNAQLCGLGGAVHDNVQKAHSGGGDHTATINIP